VLLGIDSVTISLLLSFPFLSFQLYVIVPSIEYYFFSHNLLFDPFVLSTHQYVVCRSLFGVIYMHGKIVLKKYKFE